MRELTLPIMIHIGAVAPALVIGVIQMLTPKGTRPHKWLGWTWVLAMVVAAVSSFWIMGIRKGAGLSLVHLLSIWVLISLSLAIYFIRKGNVQAHKKFMVGTLLGLAGAGIGAMVPGRLLPQLLF